MKRSVLRIGCAVLSLSAAAGLLASCSLLPPASPLPDSKPAQAEEAPGSAAASLDDGKLRILYSNGSNGGNTVLCGNTVLYQAASSETVYLVPDTLTGTVRYYLRQWSAPGTPTGRATALCDRSGKEILTFDRAYDAALTGSLLVLTAPEQMAYAPCNNHAAGDCRVIDLATGEELAVPENAYGCSIAGSYLAFEVCNVPADYVPENEWGDDLTAYCAVQVQDRQGEVVYQAELSGLSKIGWAPRHLFICHKRCAVQLGVATHRVMLHIDDARTFRRNPAQSFRTPFVAPCKIGLHLGGTVGDRPLHSEVLHQPVLHEPIVGEGTCRRIRTREVLRLRVEELDCRRSAIVPRSRIAIAGNAPARLRVRENPVEVLPESPHGICSALCRLDEPVA